MSAHLFHLHVIHKSWQHISEEKINNFIKAT
jgi:hypothetical protein